jgi:VIT1/CCC1 family predicted Fe2+/Mn2+ transporter
MDRISEVLFGLIMVLTCTSTISVVTADRIQIRTMLIGALGCNLAWGIIDAGMYLMARLHEQGRNILMLRAAREASAPEAAQAAIAGALPPLLASVLTQEQLELMRQKLRQLPEPPMRPSLTKKDWVGAVAACLLVFLSTLPVAIPFMLTNDARLALRVSNAIAIVMLFLCGYLFGRHAGLRPWLSGLSSVAIGSVLVIVAIALGG